MKNQKSQWDASRILRTSRTTIQTKTSFLHIQVVQDSCQTVRMLSQIFLWFSQFGFKFSNEDALIKPGPHYDISIMSLCRNEDSRDINTTLYASAKLILATTLSLQHAKQDGGRTALTRDSLDFCEGNVEPSSLWLAEWFNLFL